MDLDRREVRGRIAHHIQDRPPLLRDAHALRVEGGNDTSLRLDRSFIATSCIKVNSKYRALFLSIPETKTGSPCAVGWEIGCELAGARILG